jgi:hypothetical protein
MIKKKKSFWENGPRVQKGPDLTSQPLKNYLLINHIPKKLHDNKEKSYWSVFQKLALLRKTWRRRMTDKSVLEWHSEPKNSHQRYGLAYLHNEYKNVVVKSPEIWTGLSPYYMYATSARFILKDDHFKLYNNLNKQWSQKLSKPKWINY